MISIEEIQRYGGKAALLRYVQTELPNVHIPRFVTIQNNESIDSITQKCHTMQLPVVVRSSSPYEFDEFDGIFESYRQIEDASSLFNAVRKVKNSAFSEKAKKYAQQNGITIDDTMHLIIQEQSAHKNNGIAVRHPNNPDLIIMHQSEVFRNRKMSSFLGATIYDTKKNAVIEGQTGQSIEAIVKLFKEIEPLMREIKEGYSLMIEFQAEQEKVDLLQVKPFKKQETTHFELPKLKNFAPQNCIYSDTAFGITPPEGIVYPVTRNLAHLIVCVGTAFSSTKEFYEFELGKIKFGLHDPQLMSNIINRSMMYGSRKDLDAEETPEAVINRWLAEGDALHEKPYCLISEGINRVTGMDLSVPHMAALVMTPHTGDYLLHDYVRLLKRADVSVLLRESIDNYPLFYNTRTLADSVRIISNGKEALVLAEPNLT